MPVDPSAEPTAAEAALIAQLNAEIAAHGQSARSVAAALGCDYNTLRRWVTGERQIRAVTLLEVLDVLHVDRSVFMARVTAREHGR